MSDIDYYLLRARAELRLTQASPRQEVSLIHFKLANAYLQRIKDLLRAAGGQPTGNKVVETLPHPATQNSKP